MEAEAAGCDGAGTARGLKGLVECFCWKEIIKLLLNIGQTDFLHPVVYP